MKSRVIQTIYYNYEKIPSIFPISYSVSHANNIKSRYFKINKKLTFYSHREILKCSSINTKIISPIEEGMYLVKTNKRHQINFFE